jgi:hypothetical protein
VNLFVVGCNLPKKRHKFAFAELEKMPKIYPQLDPKTSWSRSSSCGTLFAASMHINKQVASPRRYVDQSTKQVIFYTGLPVSSIESCQAHRAEALALHWKQAGEILEGHYAIVRAAFDKPQLELLTDILGYEQVFYTHSGETWLVSNSVYLLEQITHHRTLDPLGVSLFLSTGYVCADRTLRSEIRVIPAGQHFKWKKGDTGPQQRYYYPPSRLAHLPRQAKNPSYFKNLSAEMAKPCHHLSKSFDNIKCSLTGGRDSRLIAAILIGSGIKASYYTYGDPEGLDIKIAAQIANAFDLPYEVTNITMSDVIRNWDDACLRSVRQTDGMRSLILVAGILQNSNLASTQKDIVLWGAGGEIARCFYAKPNSFLGKFDAIDAQRLLLKKRNSDFGGLIRKQGTALVRDYICRFVTECLDDGFDPIDIPDLFGMYQGDGRRVGNNARALMSIRDVFSLYCTRAFIEASFATPILQRYSESLHFNLMKLLAPQLLHIPFESKKWPLQNSLLNVLYAYGNHKFKGSLRRIHLYNPAKQKRKERQNAVNAPFSWFEAKREHMRSLCLDQINSAVWDFVDRVVYEKLTDSTTAQEERLRCLKALFNISTLFYYDNDSNRKSKTN